MKAAIEPSDMQFVIDDLKVAIKGVNSNSKLRSHYLKLAMMNNVMRAFVTIYDLDPKYKASQEALLATLTRVEARKDRNWLSSDKIALELAFVDYQEIVMSSTEDQMIHVLEFVDFNRTEGRWLVTKKKKG